ncbi:MAG: hypothetical protein EP332_06200 [Bacteroidetes bacterium]|nr:MAG: hypothetical protein EP332_06200 [Bacteroidota bacterium]
MRKTIHWVFALSLFFTACDNTLDITGPAKETMIVYSLIDKADSIHYVRVNKGFISEDVAPIELAKDADQLFFDSLDVTVKNLGTGEVFSLAKQSIEKNEGVFNSAVNYVYSFQHKFTEGTQLLVTVHNPLSGVTATGRTFLVGDPTLTSPSPTTINTFNFEPDINFFIGFTGHRDAVEYEAKIGLVYDETDINSQAETRDTLWWNFARGKFGDLTRVSIRTDGQIFYDYLASRLEQKGSNIKRKGIAIVYELWQGDEEMSIYSEVFDNSSIGIVQKKQDYTNVENGYGLIGSRTRTNLYGTAINGKVQTQLQTNPVMTRFNFAD